MATIDADAHVIAAVEDSGVVPAAQFLAYIGQGERGLLAQEVHRDLAGEGEIPGAARAAEILRRD